VENSRVRSTASHSRRAQRTSMQVPLHYREAGTKDWHEGRMENISTSGVLFRAPKVFDPHTPMEFTYVLPVEVGGGKGATVDCGGQIVRTILPTATDETSSMAVKILYYHLNRERQAM
jgi:hypothetical protein